MILPTIELKEIRLRAPQAKDAQALHACLSNPLVTELTSHSDTTLPAVEKFIERAQSLWAAGDLSKWTVALQASDFAIGTCGFNTWSREHKWAELAYELAHDQWGKGFMSQAVAAVLRLAFEEWNLNRVHAYVMVGNARSERVLERAGFSREGRLREFRICRGRPADFSIFSLLRSEWKGHRH